MFESSSRFLLPVSGVGLLRVVDRASEVELALGAELIGAVEADRRAQADVIADVALVVVHGPVAAWEADPASMSADAAVDALVAVQAARARLDAAEVRLMVRAAGPSRVVREVLVEDRGPDGEPRYDRDPRVVELVDEAAEEVAAALRRSPDQVRYQLRIARILTGPLARTLAEMTAGRITLGHAQAVADQATRLAPTLWDTNPGSDVDAVAACAELQDRVLPHAHRETVRGCRDRARRAVTRIDPAGAAERRRQAKRHADVVGRALDDGMAIVESTMPATDAQALLATVDAQARAVVAAGTVTDLGLPCDATLGQVRAAVLARLVRDGHAGDSRDPAAGRVAVEVGVLIDAATLAGLTPDGPVTVTCGRETTDASRADLLALLEDPGVDVTFRRLVTDPLTGALVDRGARSYAATDALRAFLVARDQACTHPGCTRPAEYCDVDHLVDHADGGPTTRANTHLYCRRHHNSKTHGGWTIDDLQPDGYTLISPAGRRYPHTPPPITEPARPPDHDPPPF